MSACLLEPRLGTAPSAGEKVRVSDVRFSSRTLSEPVTGTGSGVGVVALSGRKIVLNPCPFQVPANAASGPRLGDGTGDGARVSLGTSLNRNSLGSAMRARVVRSSIASPLQRSWTGRQTKAPVVNPG